MTMLMVICVNNINSNNVTENNYISLHKFLANYKPKVLTDEQNALSNVHKIESIYVKNNK